MPPSTLAESTPECATGQVEWRFKCLWGASGEEDADPAYGSRPPEPWWNPVPLPPLPPPPLCPPPPPTPNSGSSSSGLFHQRRSPLDAIRPRRARTLSRTHAHDPNDTDTDTDIYPETYPDNSNMRYRIARRQNPNARFGLGTGERLGDRYWSVLPDHVRGPLGTESGSGSGWGQGGFGYEGVPNGWWCERCGRVNYQALMRMRWCESERCRVSVVFFDFVGRVGTDWFVFVVGDGGGEGAAWVCCSA